MNFILEGLTKKTSAHKTLWEPRHINWMESGKFSEYGLGVSVNLDSINGQLREREKHYLHDKFARFGERVWRNVAQCTFLLVENNLEIFGQANLYSSGSLLLIQVDILGANKLTKNGDQMANALTVDG